MIVYPAIDLMGGRCVRLRQGRFEDASVYDGDPQGALDRFAAAGASWAHVVDLDGARGRFPSQHDLIRRMVRAAPLKLQVAGGFRNRDQVARMLDAGAARVVVGSLAVEDPALAADLIEAFGAERVGLALDVNLIAGTPVVAMNGWTQSSFRSLYDIAIALPRARHLLVTDIGRDGMLAGPSLALFQDVRRRLPHRALQASGGVTGAGDVTRLAAIGCAGAIIGKAMWEGALDLAEAVRIAAADSPAGEGDAAAVAGEPMQGEESR